MTDVLVEVDGGLMRTVGKFGRQCYRQVVSQMSVWDFLGGSKVCYRVECTLWNEKK